jgi:NitT/TauT family transport system substrate-binding protein
LNWTFRQTVVTAILLVAFTEASSSRALSQRKEVRPTQIRIARSGPYSLSYLPIYVAYERGFFKKQFLNVQFIQMSASITVPALLNHEVDYTVVLGPAASAAARGAPLKIICFTSVKLQHTLVVRPEIASLKDLAGKTIGVGALRDLTWYEAQFLIEKYNLGPHTTIVTLGQAGLGVAALQAGNIDAAIISVPQDIKAEEMGLKRLVQIGDILPVPQVGLATHVDKIKNSREEVLRVVKSSIGGLDYVRSNAEDTSAIIAAWAKLTQRQSTKAFDAVKDTFSEQCIPTLEQEKSYLSVLKVTAALNENVQPSAVFDFSLAETAIKETAGTRQ